MAIIYLDPIGVGTVNDWSPNDPVGTIDEGIREPGTPGDGEVYSSLEDQVGEWTFPSIGATTGTTSVVYIWIHTNQTEPKAANLKWDGAWQTENVTKDASSDEWDRYDFSITDDLSPGITDIQARLKCGSGEDDSVKGMYIEVVHDGDVYSPIITVVRHWEEEEQSTMVY